MELPLFSQWAPGYSEDHVPGSSAGEPGSDSHTVVHLRPVPRGPLWGVAGGHLPWGEQLARPEVPAAAVEHHPADCPAALHRCHGAGPAPVAAGPVGAGCRAGPEAAHPAEAVGTENPAVPSWEAAPDPGL
ncbi:hypothetical protein Nmel_015657 [Mimus melanotis]